MSPDTDFSEEDNHLCQENQLGELQEAFRLKPDVVFNQILVSATPLIVGIITMISAILTPDEFPGTANDSHSIGLFVGLCFVIVGCVTFVTQWRAQYNYIYICENGLLESRKTLFRTRVEVVHWTDMMSIDTDMINVNQKCIIHYQNARTQGDTTYTPAKNYENIDALVKILKERSQKFIAANNEKATQKRIGYLPKREDGAKYPCPCCGYKTLTERAGYEICPVCFWEDDGQNNNDLYIYHELNPNHMSLGFARENYQKYGAISKEGLAFVRPPLPEEV